ncbi:hypothetical protein PAMP_009772 [Pampus punctatissimus]
MAKEIGVAAGVLGTLVATGGANGQDLTYRQCTIKIKNDCNNYGLFNPRMYIESGGCTVPLSPFIASSKSDIAQFSKTPYTACGSVGVFTYDLLKDTDQPTQKIAVMFSVPYDFNLYSNWYAVGIFDESKQCDYELYSEMYKGAEKSFKRGKASDPCLIYEDDRFTIMATMSDTYQPVIKLHVTEIPMNRLTK